MPDVNPTHSTITPADAHAALARLAKNPPDVEARRTDAEALRAAMAAWRYAIDHWHRFRYCPACGAWISALYAAEHVSACYLAPAVARTAQARPSCASSRSGPCARAPDPGRPTGPWRYRHTRVHLATSSRRRRLPRVGRIRARSARRDRPPRRRLREHVGENLAQAVYLLEHVLSEWAVYHARARSWCEWCGWNTTSLNTRITWCAANGILSTSARAGWRMPSCCCVGPQILESGPSLPPVIATEEPWVGSCSLATLSMATWAGMTGVTSSGRATRNRGTRPASLHGLSTQPDDGFSPDPLHRELASRHLAQARPRRAPQPALG